MTNRRFRNDLKIKQACDTRFFSLFLLMESRRKTQRETFSKGRKRLPVVFGERLRDHRKEGKQQQPTKNSEERHQFCCWTSWHSSSWIEVLSFFFRTRKVLSNERAMALLKLKIDNCPWVSMWDFKVRRDTFKCLQVLKKEVHSLH